MKITNILLVVVLCLFFVGCTGPAFPEKGNIEPFMKDCTDSDECIPYPGSWEPTECINMIYKDDFEAPKGSPSMMAKEGVVYKAEDCLCAADVCTPKFEMDEIEQA